MSSNNVHASEDGPCLLDLTFMKNKSVSEDPSFVEIAVNGILDQDTVVAQRKIKFNDCPMGPKLTKNEVPAIPKKSILVNRENTTDTPTEQEIPNEEVLLLLRRCFNFCNLDTDGIEKRSIEENLESISYGIISTFRFHECCYKYAHELETTSKVKAECPIVPLVEGKSPADAELQHEAVVWKIEAEALGIKNNVLMVENGKLINELTSLRQTIRNLRDEKENLKAQVYEKDIQLFKLKDKIKDNNIETQTKIKQLQDTTGRLEKVITQRTSTISNLKQDRHTLRKQLAKSTENNINLKGANNRLKQHVDNLLYLFNDCENPASENNPSQLPQQFEHLKLTSDIESDHIATTKKIRPLSSNHCRSTRNRHISSKVPGYI
ncbi:uncharacterized protein Ecym_3119 [Eremothecium cymbalariae DBVPG|uniref:Uncharacterized protein n=1 Tax=Eremothecium cymbalariae (strain CBS 270.75 / DBVPG 7215 / KCTC 17166 / NRRL Y-17582) TaxID=931890 RepID=G8JR55_ERECY|nr:Hypothetical protein Ecym_3119 [Eremothecium cymbalariae DBVPG\